jgi:hypothetical protein
MITTTWNIFYLESTHLLNEYRWTIWFYIFITNSQLAASVAAHSVNVIQSCNECRVLISTWYHFDWNAINAKSGLWHVEIWKTSAELSLFFTYITYT